MGCGISSNSPVVTKRLAGRTSRVEDCSPLEKSSSSNRVHSSTSIHSIEHPELPANIYSSNSNYRKENDPTKKSPSDSPDPLVDQQKYNSALMAKSRRGITAVLSKTLSNNKSIDQLEGESDRQTGKESVETNNSRNDSNYGSYSAEMSKTPVSFICVLFFLIFKLNHLVSLNN